MRGLEKWTLVRVYDEFKNYYRRMFESQDEFFEALADRRSRTKAEEVDPETSNAMNAISDDLLNPLVNLFMVDIKPQDDKSRYSQ